MEVYLDLAVLLNIIVDFLLLLGTNRLAGFPPDQRRCLWAAVFGGIYSGMCVLPGFSFLSGIFWRCVSFCLMGSLAFGCNRSAVKRCGIFLLLSMALGGMAVSLGRGHCGWLLPAAAGIWVLCSISFGDKIGGQEYIPMTIRYGSRTASLVALKDSGNTLRDPITGERVLLIAGSVARKLTDLTESQMKDPLTTLTQRPIPGLRLIPYRAIGVAGGLLLGMRFENIRIGTITQSAIVAFAPEGLGRGEIYQALITGE